MFNIKTFYLPVIICLFVSIQYIDSVKYNHISAYVVNGEYWDGEAVADLTCGSVDNEQEILGGRHYIGNYFKTRVGLIRFHNCRFPQIQRKYGVEFYNLHTFNISGIELESFQNETLQGIGNLKTFIASDNRLTEIPAHLFKDARKLETIDFSNNAIRNIRSSSFAGPIGLTKLNLSSNQINQRYLQFISKPTLKILDLSLNPIGSLTAKVLANFSNLEHLSLRQANITSIEPKTFIHQQKLISLDLSENRLTRLNINLFHPTAQSSLRSLSLHHNQLTELHCVLNSTLTEFNFLDLNDNNFNCSYLKQFMDFVQWERPNYRNRGQQLNKIGNGNVNDVKCTNANSAASKYNQFQVEFCPGFENNKEKIVGNFSLLQATLILICICILAILSVIYNRQYGTRFRFIPNHLNFKRSGSTVQMTIE